MKTKRTCDRLSLTRKISLSPLLAIFIQVRIHPLVHLLSHQLTILGYELDIFIAW